MLNAPWSPAVLFLLRQVLFLGPLCMVLVAAMLARNRPRRLVGALFSFLYGLAFTFLGHVAAGWLGFWTYGGSALEIMGVPADIWFGGAFLWGPALFLAFPKASPWILAIPFMVLNGVILRALTPFVSIERPDWYAAVLAVFLVAHVPSLYLAQWTAANVRLPSRAFLLAMGYGVFAFFVVPTTIMHAMGGDWSDLWGRPIWALCLGGAIMLPLWVMGLAAVQMFVVHGEGTPIPLDPTQRLVRTGIYAYLSNPMQLSTALAWIVIGALLGNPWIALAAGMAVLFVLGLVRFHHRQDLEVRFPAGWPEYSAAVPAWIPRWKPWVPQTALLTFDPQCSPHRALVRAVNFFDPAGLELKPIAERQLHYRGAQDEASFVGFAAAACALTHGNFLTALLSSGMLLVVLPAQALGKSVATWGRRLGQTSPLAGLTLLPSLRSDPVGVYQRLQAKHGDVVRFRVGPYRMWLLSDPGSVEAVLASRAGAFVRFEPMMRILAQWNGSSLLIVEGAQWKMRRRQVLPAFASRRLSAYGTASVRRAAALCDRWQGMGERVEVDTDKEMAKLTLAIATDTLFGRDLGAEAETLAEAVAVLSETAFRETTSPLGALSSLSPRRARAKREAMSRVDALVKTIVADRLITTSDDQGDLLSMLVASERDPASLRDEVVTLMIAGHETSGALLAWVAHLLGRNPRVAERLKDELDRELADRPANHEDLARLPYLSAVIDEALRLYPPAFALFARRATEDVDLGTVKLRLGDVIHIVPSVLHRDARWFVEPELFRPERFLETPTWPQYAYIPFGAGPRACIGRAFGLSEVGLVLATLLQRYSPQDTGVVKAQARFSLRPQGGLPQVWVSRNRMAHT